MTNNHKKFKKNWEEINMECFCEKIRKIIPEYSPKMIINDVENHDADGYLIMNSNNYNIQIVKCDGVLESTLAKNRNNPEKATLIDARPDKWIIQAIIHKINKKYSKPEDLILLITTTFGMDVVPSFIIKNVIDAIPSIPFKGVYSVVMKDVYGGEKEEDYVLSIKDCFGLPQMF